MTKKTVTTIDIEPTWVELCKASELGALPAIELMPACQIADKIRQAQKKGATSILFEFKADGIEITEDYPK
mgnify:CR=1 FL=1